MDRQDSKRKRKENDEGDNLSVAKKPITSFVKTNKQHTSEEASPVRRPATRQIGPFSILEHLPRPMKEYLDNKHRNDSPLDVTRLTPVLRDDNVDSWPLPSDVYRFSGNSADSAASNALRVSTTSTVSTSFNASTASTAPTELRVSTASTFTAPPTPSSDNFNSDAAAQKAQSTTLESRAQPLAAEPTESAPTKEQVHQAQKVAEHEQQLQAQTFELQDCARRILMLEQSLQGLQKERTDAIVDANNAANQKVHKVKQQVVVEVYNVKQQVMAEVDNIKRQIMVEVDNTKQQASEDVASLKNDFAREYAAVKEEKTRAEQERDTIKTAYNQAQQENAQMMTSAEKTCGQLRDQVASLQKALDAARQENKVLQSSRNSVSDTPSDAILVNFLLKIIAKANPQQPGWSKLTADTIPGDLHDVFRSTLQFERSVASLIDTVLAYYGLTTGNAAAVQSTEVSETGLVPQVTGIPMPVELTEDQSAGLPMNQDMDARYSTYQEEDDFDPTPADYGDDMGAEDSYGNPMPANTEWTKVFKQTASKIESEDESWCRNGSECHFLKKGTCHFQHSSEDYDKLRAAREDDFESAGQRMDEDLDESILGQGSSNLQQPRLQGSKKSDRVRKFGTKCNKPGVTCPYQHPERVAELSIPIYDPTSPGGTLYPESAPVQSQVPCRYGAGCRDPHNCLFFHPDDSQIPTISLPPTVVSPYLQAPKKKQKVLCKFGLTSGGCLNAVCKYAHPGDTDYPIPQKLIDSLTTDLPKPQAMSVRKIKSHITFMDPIHLPKNLTKKNREVVVQAMWAHVNRLEDVLISAPRADLQKDGFNYDHLRELGERLGLWVDKDADPDECVFNMTTAAHNIVTLLYLLPSTVVGRISDLNDLPVKKFVDRLKEKDEADDEGEDPLSGTMNGEEIDFDDEL